MNLAVDVCPRNAGINNRRRVATIESIEQITFVVIYTAHLKHRNVLVLERLIHMVVTLILDVLDDTRHVLLADTKYTKTVLPLERTHPVERFMYPPRRFAFQPLHDLARCKFWFSQYQNMNMILDSADLNSDDLVISRNSANVRPYTFFDVLGDQILPALCAENDVVEQI